MNYTEYCRQCSQVPCVCLIRRRPVDFPIPRTRIDAMLINHSESCGLCHRRPCVCSTGSPSFDGFCGRCHFRPCVCSTAPFVPFVPDPQPQPIPQMPSYPAVEPEPPLTHDEIRRVRRLLRRIR